MVEAASKQTGIGPVLVDSEFDSKSNHTFILQRLGTQSMISAERKRALCASTDRAPRWAGVPSASLSAPCSDREAIQFHEAQALGSCATLLAAHPDAPGSVGRIEFQSTSPEGAAKCL